eukprot:6182967-Pleurochrysis_carterae.AAC.5
MKDLCSELARLLAYAPPLSSECFVTWFPHVRKFSLHTPLLVTYASRRASCKWRLKAGTEIDIDRKELQVTFVTERFEIWAAQLRLGQSERERE